MPFIYKDKNYKEVSDEIESKLSSFNIDSKKDFGSHCQFRIESLGVLRFYQKKDGSTTIDDSQIKDKEKLQEALGMKFEQHEKKAKLSKEMIDVINADINSIDSDVIGIDESGKGDFFGPLVVAGVFIHDKNAANELIALGIKDSKTISDGKIIRLAEEIKKKCRHTIVKLMPEKYNDLYTKTQNLNSLLGWAHARAIENICEETRSKYAISDKFGNEYSVKSQLMPNSQGIELIQRTKAESNVAVAAASIIARAEFVLLLQELSFKYGMEFPKGASEKVKEIGKHFLHKYGIEKMSLVCKKHFKTFQEIINISKE